MADKSDQAYLNAVYNLFPAGRYREELESAVSTDEENVKADAWAKVRSVIEKKPDDHYVSNSEASVYLDYSTHHIQRLRGKAWPAVAKLDWKYQTEIRRRVDNTGAGKQSKHEVVVYRMSWLRAIKSRLEQEHQKDIEAKKAKMERTVMKQISTLKDAKALLAFLKSKDGTLICPIGVAGLTESQWKAANVTVGFVSLQDAVTEHLWTSAELRKPWANGYELLLKLEMDQVRKAEALTEKARYLIAF